MGMGEPLANEGAVWGAVERLHGDLGLSARHLTISTVGIVPGIRSLAARPLPVNLAVSLHAANDTLRDELVPINRRYPIDALIDACADYLRVRNRRISFEWAMIDGVNDRPSDAVELAALCRRLRPAAHVNLIPLNPTPGYPTRGTPPARVHEFRDRLDALGANATVRRNRGTDIDAACGQLAAGRPVTLGRTRPHRT
jgi:23S rRNA (adenine2503-C2)-methyltransferase